MKCQVLFSLKNNNDEKKKKKKKKRMTSATNCYLHEKPDVIFSENNFYNFAVHSEKKKNK